MQRAGPHFLRSLGRAVARRETEGWVRVLGRICGDVPCSGSRQRAVSSTVTTNLKPAKNSDSHPEAGKEGVEHGAMPHVEISAFKVFQQLYEREYHERYKMSNFLNSMVLLAEKQQAQRAERSTSRDPQDEGYFFKVCCMLFRGALIHAIYLYTRYTRYTPLGRRPSYPILTSSF